jgi:hypothetical protein
MKVWFWSCQNPYTVTDGHLNYGTNKHLRAALEKLGFVMDKQDTCLFTKHNCVFVVYVDDAILISPQQDIIDNVLQGLANLGLDLERMGTMSDFLGVKITQLDDGTLELTQPSLTRRLIEVLGLTQSRPVSTPADGALGKGSTDPPASGEFNYRSAIGMAMFLTNNTRLDCSMAVHQCARYSVDPRSRHEQAVKRIGRYLLGNWINYSSDIRSHFKLLPRCRLLWSLQL